MAGSPWLLEDLRGLSEPFHLTPVGLARGGGEWKPLDEMLTLVRSESGRRWLNACRLRIYVPDNFLTLWRRWFASCLGFSYIPGGEWTVAPEDNNGCAKQHDDSPALKAPADVKAWLREHGLKQKELATAIGWSPARVSHVLVGRTKWSAEFEEAVNQVARHSAQGMATPT